MQKINVYAPVLIPTLCRYKHFRDCVESLSKCTLADETVLFIALDYPLNKSHEDGYRKIKEYIPNITGFKEVRLIERGNNYGAGPNLWDARDRIYKEFDRYILSEDDNVFSPNFLVYINKVMAKYDDNPNVVAVCGYNYPVSMEGYNKNMYASHEFSAWGVGHWRDKNMVYSKEMMDKILRNPWTVIKLSILRPGILITLVNMMEKGALWGDTCRVALAYLDNKYTITPTISKVRNTGHDGSGVHCLSTDRYVRQEIDKETSFDPDEIELSSPNIKGLKGYFGIKFKTYLYMLKRVINYQLKRR